MLLKPYKTTILFGDFIIKTKREYKQNANQDFCEKCNFYTAKREGKKDCAIIEEFGQAIVDIICIKDYFRASRNNSKFVYNIYSIREV